MFEKSGVWTIREGVLFFFVAHNPKLEQKQPKRFQNEFTYFSLPSYTTNDYVPIPT